MVRHGASFDEAPLKLEPPYLHMGEDLEHAFVEFCNTTDAVSSNGPVYAMLVGGEHCMSYELVAEEEPNDVCIGIGHGASSSLADALAEAAEVAPHHFVYASCSGSEPDLKNSTSALAKDSLIMDASSCGGGYTIFGVQSGLVCEQQARCTASHHRL